MSTETVSYLNGRTLDSRSHIIEPIVTCIAITNGLQRISSQHAQLVLEALVEEFCGSGHRSIFVGAIHQRAREEIHRYLLIKQPAHSPV